MSDVSDGDVSDNSGLNLSGKAGCGFAGSDIWPAIRKDTSGFAFGSVGAFVGPKSNTKRTPPSSDSLPLMGSLRHHPRTGEALPLRRCIGSPLRPQHLGCGHAAGTADWCYLGATSVCQGILCAR